MGQNEQEKAWELITEYASIFAISDMDLGKSYPVKHSIRLIDDTSFGSVIGESYEVCMRKLENI